MDRHFGIACDDEMKGGKNRAFCRPPDENARDGIFGF
jgi:hypothetical protein